MTTAYGRGSLYSVLAILKMTHQDPYRAETIPTPWVDYHTLRADVARQVSAGYALRFFNRDREEKYRRQHNLPADAEVPPRARDLTRIDMIQRGQIGVARKLLNAKCFERTDEDEEGNRTIRLKRMPRWTSANAAPGHLVPTLAAKFATATLESDAEYKMTLADAEVLERELAMVRRELAAWEEAHPDAAA